MVFDIRHIQKKDNVALSQMIRAVFVEFGVPKEGTVYSDPATDNLFALFQHPKSVLWVLAVNGYAEGCCGVYPTDGLSSGYAELVKFYLSKSFRNNGFGRTLMDQAVASAQQLGYTHLYLESFPQFAGALTMYEKAGFKKTDHPLGNSGHHACNVWMIKKL